MLVGRNNRENDILTFKTASSRETYGCVPKISGSHVISKKTSCEEISDEDLYAAASMAAYHSKGTRIKMFP